MGEACLDGMSYKAATVPSSNTVSMHSHCSHWYTLKVRTGGEKAAAAALDFRGYEYYCPMQTVRRRYSDRMKVVTTAMFPGYVFCRFDAQEKLPIISSPGVEYILGSSSEGPTAVPEEELVNVKRMVEAGGSSISNLEAGTQVRVTNGPLEGIEGTLVRDAAGDRLVVLVAMLRRGAFLHIDLDQISLVEKQS